jgi:hypothetical protein
LPSAVKWRQRRSPKHSVEQVARGHGVAVSLRVGTYDAAVAEVEVDRRSGHVRVPRVVIAQDNGLTINPRCNQTQYSSDLASAPTTPGQPSASRVEVQVLTSAYVVSVAVRVGRP